MSDDLAMAPPFEPDGETDGAMAPPSEPDGGERADLREVRERHEVGLDAARPEAVAERRERGRRTTRENLAELLDPESFVEYGPLVFAAQERRRAREDLIARTPADGLVAGVGEVDGMRCVAMSYDYTVLAGTQGMRGNRKKDRLFEIAERRRLHVVLFAEGGGGRPGDVDAPIVAGLDCRTFNLFGRLSGLVPLNRPKRLKVRQSSPATIGASTSPGRPPPPSANSTTGSRRRSASSNRRSFLRCPRMPWVPASTV